MTSKQPNVVFEQHAALVPSIAAGAREDDGIRPDELRVVNRQQEAALQAQISAHLELSRQYLPKLFSSDVALTELKLANSNCSDVSVTALTDGLKGNTSLRLLDLSSNGITDEGCIMIAEAIEQNHCLTSLSLARNCIGDRGAARMVDALCVNNSLLQIDVSGNEDISQTQLSEVTMLAQLNAHSTRLKQTLLQLRRNEIGDTLDLSRASVQMKEFRDLAHNQREHLDDWAAEMLSKYLADNKTVTFVDLSCQHIGDIGAFHIAQMLRKNTKIDRLVLQHNLITCVGAQYLMDAVSQSNNSLRFMSLFKNALSQDYAVKLEWVMAVNRQPLTLKDLLARLEADDPAVTSVALDDHLCQRFYDDIAARLVADALRKNSYVRSLAITNSSVTVIGARFIADMMALNDLIELVDLSNCPIGVGAGYLARSLALHKTIRTVRLANTNMTDVAASHLAEALMDNTSITELDISHNPLVSNAGEAFVKALNKNVTVEKLLLEGTSISDRVLLEISERQRLLSEPEQLRQVLPLLFTQSSSLQELDLDGRKFDRQLTDTAMGLLSEALGQNYVTQRCSLANNRITYTGMVHLAGALSENSSTLTHLDLANNPIGRGQEFGRLLAGILDMHSALQVLNVSATGLDDLGARSIIAIHSKDGQLPIRQVVIENNRDISASVGFVLGVLVQMNSLLFSFKVRFRPVLTRWLSCLDMVLPFGDTHLDLANYASGEITLSGNLPEIRKKCNDAAQIICRFALLVPTLTSINFSRNGIDCDGATHFASLLVQHSSITSLNLSGNIIGDRGAIALQRGVEQAANLNALDISSNPLISDHIQQAIRTVITYNLQTPEIKSILVRLRNHDEKLSVLNFGDRGGAGCDDPMLVDDQVLLMVPALDGNPYVTKLDFSNNYISVASFAVLCELLQKRNCFIRSLSVKNTNISGLETGILVQKVLAVNQTLQELDISYNDLGDEAGKVILAAVRLNSTLRVLRTTSCGFSPETDLELACAAEMNQSSTSSGLKDLLATKVSPISSGDAASTLPSSNSEVIEFDGADKGFSSGNALEICNVFKNSSTLTLLDLSRNDLSDKCGAQIFQILSTNASIRTLNLAVNCFGRETLRELGHLLRINTTMTDIDLRRNDLPLDDLIRLSETLLDDSDTIQAIHLHLSSIVTSVNPIAARRVVDFFEHTLSLNKFLKLKKMLPQLRSNNPHTTEIDLAGLGCNNVGAKFIGDAVTHSTVVVSIDLSNGVIGDAGLIELCRGLSVNRSVTDLNLANNDIGDDGLSALCDVLKVNSIISKITVFGNPRMTQLAVDNLRRVLVINDSLRSLQVVDSSKQQQRHSFDMQRLDFALLLNNRHGSLKDLMRREGEFLVREINCSNAASNGLGRVFDDRACEVLCQVLAENRFVTSVDISNNSITSAAADYLETLLLRNRSITELNASYNHLGDGVMRLCDVLKYNHTLRFLRLEHNGASATTIERTQLLLSLNAEPLPFKSEMLRILEADSQDVDTVCKVNIPEIEVYEGRKNQMNDDSVTIASGILKSSLKITSVDFSWNGIGDNGFSEILRLLRRNVGISSISLAHNFICDEAIRELHNNIHQLQHFTSLDLSHNAVTAETFPDIIRILSHNSQLSELKLQGNRIPPQKLAVIEFFAAVNKNAPGAMRSILNRSYENASSLTEVVCDGFFSVGIWSKSSMKLLAFALQANTTVRTLSLEFNDIDDSSVAYLAGVMSVNSSIITLSVANNLLTDVTQLVKALRENSSLQVLNLRNNRLNLASAQALKHCRTSVCSNLMSHGMHGEISERRPL